MTHYVPSLIALLITTIILIQFPEFIVEFQDYFEPGFRDGVIHSALTDAGIVSWQVVPHHKLLKGKPSDFDVIKVHFQTLYPDSIESTSDTGHAFHIMLSSVWFSNFDSTLRSKKSLI